MLGCFCLSSPTDTGHSERVGVVGQGVRFTPGVGHVTVGHFTGCGGQGDEQLTVGHGDGFCVCGQGVRLTLYVAHGRVVGHLIDVTVGHLS